MRFMTVAFNFYTPLMDITDQGMRLPKGVYGCDVKNYRCHVISLDSDEGIEIIKKGMIDTMIIPLIKSIGLEDKTEAFIDQINWVIHRDLELIFENRPMEELETPDMRLRGKNQDYVYESKPFFDEFFEIKIDENGKRSIDFNR